MLQCWDNDSTFWITSRVHILCLLVDISLPCLLLFWSGGDKKSTAPLFSSADSGTWHILSVAYSFLFFSHGHPNVSKAKILIIIVTSRIYAEPNNVWLGTDQSVTACKAWACASRMMLKISKTKSKIVEINVVFSLHAELEHFFWNLTADWKLRNQWLLNK